MPKENGLRKLTQDQLSALIAKEKDAYLQAFGRYRAMIKERDRRRRERKKEKKGEETTVVKLDALEAITQEEEQ